MNDRSRQLRLRAEGDEPGRLLALSDGLFATVLTILVLDLKLPGHPTDWRAPETFTASSTNSGSTYSVTC